MHFSSLLLPITFALAAVAEPRAEAKALPNGVQYAQQFRREPTNLAPRQDIDPETICGKNYNDCGDGWCCSADNACAGKLHGVPVCKDPTFTLGPLQGTAVATPYNNLGDKIQSLSSALAQMTEGTLPTDTQPEKTGAAAVVGLSSFGKTAGMVAGLWGAAALGGVGLFFL